MLCWKSLGGPIVKEGRRKTYVGKKRAGRGRGMEGFPLLNQKQLSEGRQFGNKCCFTLRAAFQIVFTIYMTKAKACMGRQDSILFARINIMPVHSCMQQHFFICIPLAVTQAIISAIFTQTLRNLSGLYFLEWVIKKCCRQSNTIRRFDPSQGPDRS